MDSLTHFAIGACIGDLFLGKKIGKKAMLYGAIAASFPDVDFIISFILKPPSDLLAHRGFTHSFLFAFIVITGLSIFFRKRHTIENIPVKTWVLFLSVALGSHLLLDAFNAYGIGWFEPFNHSRFSFNIIFVVDPFFSVWPGMAAVCLLILKKHSNKRKGWAGFGLIFCSLYLVYCMFNKFNTDDHARFAALHQGIHYNRYFTTPAPFNNWLWYVVAETDSGFYTGYRSVFDSGDHIEFRYFARNDALLKPLNSHSDLRELILFSQGYYVAESSNQGVVFNDLRFGQIMGWQNPSAGFVFHYYLQKPDANQMVVQRGRFADWNQATIKGFIKRIRGND